MTNIHQNTKQKIQQTALELFSKKGYHAVSIRDICKVVGIKESTVYYHYKNKQDILNSLFEQVKNHMDNMRNLFDSTMELATEIDRNAFSLVAAGFLENYLLEPTVYRLICILTIEKLTDLQADQMYRELLFYAPIRQQEKVFRIMMNRNLMKQADVAVLANEYNSIIFYIFQKYFCGYEMTDSCKVSAKKELETHIMRFYCTNNIGGINHDENISK